MNKLELYGIMICEWDAETRCMIVSPADGWKVNVNYPISEAHASMVTMEKMGPDYSHLIGKWVKAIGADIHFVRTGKWYQALREIDGGLVVSDENGDNDYVWTNPQNAYDLTDPREYNPDELIGKWLKRTNQITREYTWGKLRRIDKRHPDDLNPAFTFEDGRIWGQIACDVDDPRDYNPDEHINTNCRHQVPKISGYNAPRPHQLQEYDAVECTPEERAEIIMIADECGVRVFAPTEPLEGQTSLLFFRGVISGTSIRSICDDAGIKRDWHTVPDFISKIRGEYTAVNVTEHKHESV